MLIKSWNNQKGFTLVEMVIAIALGLLILSGAVITFTKQDKILKDQNADTDIRGQGRVTIKRLAGEIRNAGAGIAALLQQLPRIPVVIATGYVRFGNLVPRVRVASSPGRPSDVLRKRENPEWMCRRSLFTTRVWTLGPFA